MKLHEYLKYKKTTQQAFAERLGVTQGLVSQWIQGRTTITPLKARAIEDATNGLVTRYMLRPDVFGAAKDRATKG